MRASPALAVIGLVVLTGCAGMGRAGDRPEMGYLPPSSAPAPIPAIHAGQPRFVVFGNVVDRLVQQGLEIEVGDQASGRIVAIYWGDPEPYVDCGWIVTYDDDRFVKTPAAAPSASFRRRLDGRIIDVERALDLQAVLTVTMARQGSATVVRTDADYALTKQALAEGRSEALTDETIRFATGETAAFEVGTVCQPNGSFERLVLDALPSLAAAGP